LRDSESGSSTVEFVIWTALMVTMLTVIVQFGLYFHLRAVAQTAAREGLDHVRVVEGSPDDGIATANEFLDQAGRSLEARLVTAERGPSTSSLTVSGNVISVVPGLNLRVEVTVDAPTERVTP
jgi:Flp pilus assembly protein TadG